MRIEETPVKKLSQIQSVKGVKFLTPAAYPGSHCPMHTALITGSGIKGFSTLIVGTPECTSYSRMVIPKSEGSAGELHWLYVLDSSEVVFGCRENVLKALKTMGEAGARVILLITTCVPELIGEDMESLAREAEESLGMKVAPVSLAHFSCNSYPSGWWKTLEALGGIMEPGPRIENLVNVPGLEPEALSGDSEGLLKELQNKGIELNFLGRGASVEAFQRAASASLNLVLAPEGGPLARKMEKSLGIPWLGFQDLYGAEQIEEAYTGLEKALGIAVECGRPSRKALVLELEQRARTVLKGKSFLSGPMDRDPVPLAAYLADLGMEPLLLHLEDFFEEDRKWAKALVQKGFNPWACHLVNMKEDREVLKGLSPDLYLGDFAPPIKSLRLTGGFKGMAGLYGHDRTAFVLKALLDFLSDTPVKALSD